MSSNTNDRHIEELVSELLDGELSQEQRLELLAALRADEQTAQNVINLFIDSCVLEALHATGEPESFVKRVLLNAKYLETGESFADRVATAAFHQDMIASLAPEDKQRIEEVRRLAERQLKAFLDEQEQEKRQQQPSPRYQLDLERMAGKARAFIRYTKKAVVATTVSISIILLVLVGFQQILAHRVVATLSQTIHAQWDQAPEQNDLHPGWMRLEQGYAGIRFKDGAEVIIQAPTIFKLNTSNRMFLESGWITAKVPKEATGFTVNTPASSVIDYGTEFGLMVGTESSAEVHVFEGNIGLKSGNHTRSRQQQEFGKGEAATIDTAGHVNRSTIEDRAHLFVRTIPTGFGFGIPGKRLSLADIVGGGNGLNTGVVGHGIDPSTGNSVPTRTVLHGIDNGYMEVPSRPFIDGAFIPDSNDGPAIVTSTGIVFKECPKTLGKCHENIVNGAMFKATTSAVHFGGLAGRQYGPKESPSIGMHPNVGITFDLDKIRTFMPKVKITRFQSLCGVSETVAQYFDEEDADPRDVKVDFWVLVDGRIKFSRKLAAVPIESELINIQLAPNDRFLTLATTNPGDYLFCWAMFAEPMLELTTE